MQNWTCERWPLWTTRVPIAGIVPREGIERKRRSSHGFVVASAACWANSWRMRVCLLCVGLVGFGCSQLPAYAAPSSRVLDPSAVGEAELISYRTLSKDDFLAAAPPPERAAHADQLGALTCAYIVTTPDTGYEMREERAKGVSTFTVRFTKIGLVARMDRKCSWWNADGNPADEPYVLQHEQIHFALAEAEARRSSLRGRELARSWSEQHATSQDAEAAVQRQLGALVNDAMESLLEVSTAFDEETSVEHSPERQREWFKRVNGELAELEE
jgi:hypothetical protein